MKLKIKYKALNIFLLLPKLIGTVLGFLSKSLLVSLKYKILYFVNFLVKSTNKKIYIFLYPLLYEYLKKMAGDKSLVFQYLSEDQVLMLLDVSKKTQRQIFLGRPYEEAVTSYVKKTLRPGDVFLDIGANVGYYSLLASKLVGGEGSVVSFEPEDRNKTSLYQNIKINDFRNIKVFPVAVGEESGFNILNLNPLNEGGHSLNKHDLYHDSGDIWTKEMILEKFGNEPLEQQTEVTSLDAFIFDHKDIADKISLIKVDVEGFEREVIKGAIVSIKNGFFPRIICEISDNGSFISKELENFGYCVYFIHSDGTKDLVSGPLRPNNYLFERPEKYL